MNKRAGVKSLLLLHLWLVGCAEIEPAPVSPSAGRGYFLRHRGGATTLWVCDGNHGAPRCFDTAAVR